MLILVVGPSGAGKDTLLSAARRALSDDPRFRFVRREITRPETAGGEDHEFVDRASFEMRRAAGAYALWWEAHGLLYGIPADIALDLYAGRIVVASVSRRVVARAARRYRMQVLEITAPYAMLAERLAARGRESEADVADRLSRYVPIPADVVVTTVVNDRTPDAATSRVLEVLIRAAQADGEG